MIRDLKIMFLAAMALTALGVVDAPGAHAAEETFHCEVSPCRVRLNTDGTGSTAHHVFVLKNAVGESVSFTAESFRGDFTLEAKTTEDVTITSPVYDNCKSVIGACTVDMNKCTYKFNSRKGGTDEATVLIECEKATERIVITNGPCTVEVGPQGFLKGIGYHNVLSTTLEVTVTAKVTGIAIASATGNCGIDLSKTPLTGEYTTGNTLATAETDPGEVMVNGWWE